MSTEHTVNVQVSPWANSWDSRGVLRLQKVGVNFYLGRYETHYEKTGFLHMRK